VLAVAVLIGTGCASYPLTVSVHGVSRERFRPSEREAVWGRALAAFQDRGALIVLADDRSGVLRSEAQPSRAPCSGDFSYESEPVRDRGGIPQCNVSLVHQFTLSADGLAILRINRAVSGSVKFFGMSLVADSDIRALQSEQDAMLAGIVGEAKAK
jgi:hypothetical protein